MKSECKCNSLMEEKKNEESEDRAAKRLNMSWNCLEKLGDISDFC